jgi:hypothetical protein
LAVFLQRTIRGRPVDAAARRYCSRGDWNLRSLVERDFFFGNEYRHACYVLAGSFTSFLIERYGWEAYRKLYSTCHPHHVEWAFQSSLGTTFDEAEAQWRAA